MLLAFCAALLYSALLQAQQMQATGANTAPYTPQNLIQNIFLGEGVEVLNITFQGDPVAVGYFNDGANAVGIQRGIVMTTGRVVGNNNISGCNEDGSDFASSPNTGGSVDASLQPLVGASSLDDVAAYTITFIPTSDTLRFRYCFASEEYPEFACSPYNDVFGFFIQGPGYPTPTNIALIPNTTLPVTINNIHPSNNAYPNCNPSNAQYYNNNQNSNNQPTYDGYTDVFTAQAVVTPCQEYTIKLAIADAGDASYDSGVFLEAKSFGTGSIRAEVATVSKDGTITEGCASGNLTFTVPENLAQDLVLDYNVWGTATNGVDYTFIPSGQVIAAGTNQLAFTVEAVEDAVAEGDEYIAIDIQRDPCNRDTLYIHIRENGLVPPVLRPDTALCTGFGPLTLDGTLPIPVPPPPTFSNPSHFSVAPTNAVVESTISVFGVQPFTLTDGVIRSVCVNINHSWVDDLDLFLVSPDGKFIELTTDNGGNGDNYTNTCFTPTATVPINFPGPFAPASAAPFSGQFQIEGEWSDLWGSPTNGVWKLQVIDDTNGITGEIQDWSITFEPSYKIDYQWTPGTAISCATCPVTDVAPTQSTLYSVVATDSYGCQVTDSVQLTVNLALDAPVVSCADSDATSVTFNWNNIPGADSYQISINGGSWFTPQTNASHVISGLSPSSVVNIEVQGLSNTLACGSMIGTGTCVNCNPPAVNFTTTGVTCFNDSDGGVAFTVDNLNPPYSYRVGTASNATGIFNGLPAGDHIGIISDASGCDVSVPFNVPTPDAVSAVVTVQQEVSCYGGNNGALSATLGGGTGALDVIWNDPTLSTNTTVTGLTAGVYELRVTDSRGCDFITYTTLTEPSELQLTTTIQAANCNGTATGSITADPNGGTTPYEYLWSNGAVDQTASALQAGDYTLTLTDAHGCTVTLMSTVSEPSPLQVTLSSLAVTCHNRTDGKAFATVTGGTAPFTYLWNDPTSQNDPDAINLAPGAYTVTVTDAALCTATASTLIVAPPPLSATLSFTAPRCNGEANGTATAVAAGGNGSYQYAWNSPGLPQLSATATGLAFGTYIVTVTDNPGCTYTSSITVTQPDPLLASTLSLPTSCFGYNDGYAKVNVTGGVQPYLYQWSSGQTQSSIANQPGGVYTVSVTDANECSVVTTKIIEQPAPIVAAYDLTNILCYNGYSGAITTEVTGGSGSGYSIVWFGPYNFLSTNFDNDSLYAGRYTVTITDGNNCELLDTMELNQPDAPLRIVTPYVSDTICFDMTDGVARVDVTGGTTPYSYLWDDPASQTLASPIALPSGLYRVTVTDAHGCYQIDSTFIYQRDPLFVYLSGKPPLCHDGPDGYATVDFTSYGSAAFDPDLLSYIWDTSPEQESRTATYLLPGETYFVTATDQQGCSAVQEILIPDREPLTGFFTNVIHPLCHGDATGEAIVNGDGGTEPYHYLWSPNKPDQTNPIAQDLPADRYVVTVTDINNCQDIVELELTDPPAIVSTLLPEHVACFGASTGSIALTATGGKAPLTYLWDNGQTTSAATALNAGYHKVTITDGNGCVQIDSTLVRQPGSAPDALLNIVPTDCYGGSDGRIEINGSGGTPPYQYTLGNRPWNGSPLQIGLKAGNYLPRIQDANGCITELPLTNVPEPDPVAIDLGAALTIELGSNTQINAQVSNAHLPLETISWQAADSVWLSCLDCLQPEVRNLLFENTFELYVVDSKGCTGEAALTISVDKPRKVYVPTGFTPNEDHANDALMVHGQSSAHILDFRIFDRWGELVYRAQDFYANDEQAVWDGTLRGKPMQPDVYVWVLEVEYLDGVKEVLHGQTTLIR